MMKSYLFCLFLMNGIWGFPKQNANVQHIKPLSGVVDTLKSSWWKKAKFGMFIHWGVYSVPAGLYNGQDVSVHTSPVDTYGSGEWMMHNLKVPVATYKEYAKQFNPTAYDPEQWVLMAKAAGMKYIVITTKHHDGFALFDTKYSDWNVVKATPYGKDLIRPLADACRKYGMKIGFYYSQANDWVNRGGAAEGGHWDRPAQDGSMDEYIDKVAEPQVREILTNYGDVAELWWDIPTDMSPGRAAKFLPALQLQPNMLTNDRLDVNYSQGDFKTSEQGINASDGLWEACMTMNESWGFTKNDHNWKSSQKLIRNLIEITSLGGNYLLNVGPEASGKFPQPIIDRLKDIGAWMKVNGEAIYETTASPFKMPFTALPWGRATMKTTNNGNSILYLHVYNWPSDGKLLIPGLTNDITSATLLANGAILKSTKQNNSIGIDVPKSPLDEIATVIRLELKGPIQLVPYIPSAEKDGSILLYPAFAQLKAPKKGSKIAIESDGGDQNLGYWTNPSASASWQVQVDKKGTYQVTAQVATQSNANAIKFSLGDRTLKTQLPNTGDYGSYKTVALGTLLIDKVGVNTFTLTADPNGWDAVNVRKIILKP